MHASTLNYSADPTLHLIVPMAIKRVVSRRSSVTSAPKEGADGKKATGGKKRGETPKQPTGVKASRAAKLHPGTRKKKNIPRHPAGPHAPAHSTSGAPPVRARGNVARILKRLIADYPEVDCALHYRSPFQLLVATILSAQCTDKRVNLVTKDLFRQYRTPTMFVEVSRVELEKCIQSTGFYRNKAKNIKACSLVLLEQYGGRVPRTLEELVALPGVGRKTANVVLGTAYGLAFGVVVDTHVGRLSRRLGLSHETDPVKVERDLMTQLPKKEWIDFSHRMIYHGRAVCNARKPLCDACSLQRFCPQHGVASSSENHPQ